MTNLNDLKALLNVPKNIVLTSHRNPDGDAIGSTLGMKHLLDQFGHTVHCIFPSEYPDNVAWMPDAEDIIIFDIDPERSEEVLKTADLIFCLDYNSLSRVDKLGDLINKMDKAELVLIDHHLDPDIRANFIMSVPDASSTCELVYEFILLMEKKLSITIDVAESLLTGILTDTGSFKYSTSPRLFVIVSKLVERGADLTRLQDLIFNSMNEKQLRLLGHCLKHRMEILEEYNTALITLHRKDYETYDIQRGDTEGIVNYMLKMKNIKTAVFITEQPTVVKLSLRSKGDISVQSIASKHFKGGGHKNASGGYSFTGLRSTVAKFKEVLPEFKEMLTAG
ncbi:MAG: phosphoesterase RecJ-like protein [Polaribacter sp.]|jgi:phosphoesterase RecJ-like protein